MKDDGEELDLSPEEIEEDETRPRGKRYITPEGFKTLQAELERLWKVDRPKVTTEVMWAAAQGDRSENAEYIYGKKKLREIDRRIRFLSKRLDALTVVEPSAEQEGKVFFGAWVRVEDEDGEEATYRIVGPDELDVRSGKISVESPLARALLGKKVGDEVHVVRPKGEADLAILEIRYEPA
ncbi:Transcription elongation factor GreB [Vulgatibacter incomptus]|uniref:Transcription elongation factor GreB n=1 Tax=Vulgatibacter incomptus TaxID=1391653 RepID=A0A0K1P8E6_9BACT|nr:Transcription elongation factor GreB [Vulgatibacter incomptus]